MTSLYEIAKEYQEAFDSLMFADIDEETIKNTLDAMKADFETKALSVSKFILNLNSDLEQIKSFEQSLKYRRERLEKRISSVKDYLLSNMKKVGLDSLSCPYFDIKVKRSGGRVKIYDVDKLPVNYKKWTQMSIVDKEMLLRDLRANRTIDGAELEITERIDIK